MTRGQTRQQTVFETDAGRNSVREALLTERARILQRIGGMESDLDDGTVADSIDAANIASSKHLLAAHAAAGNDLLQQVEQAIQRLDEGSYGICGTCGKRIEAARLEAMPLAQQCISCKRQSEIRARQAGG